MSEADDVLDMIPRKANRGHEQPQRFAQMARRERVRDGAMCDDDGRERTA